MQRPKIAFFNDLINSIFLLQEASRLASSLYSSGNSLSRSVSSVGERHSAAYTSPILPKRAETFGGFDIQQVSTSHSCTTLAGRAA